jgi:hypothetical protein
MVVQKSNPKFPRIITCPTEVRLYSHTCVIICCNHYPTGRGFSNWPGISP